MISLPFGLNISMDEQSTALSFEEDVLCASVAAKTFAQIKHLSYDETQAGDDEPCYTFYHDVFLKTHANIFKKEGMSNGITVLMAGSTGYECRKNSGHHHVPLPGHMSTLSEVYEVLYGKAVFLLQQSHSFLYGEDKLKVERLRAVFVSPGEKIAIPAFCAHCAVNVGDTPLVFSNLGAPCPLDYDSISRQHGFGVYVLKVQNELVFVQNPRYTNLPLLEVKRAKECPELGLCFDQPLYTLYMQEPSKFAYLKTPQIQDGVIDALYD